MDIGVHVRPATCPALPLGKKVTRKYALHYGKFGRSTPGGKAALYFEFEDVHTRIRVSPEVLLHCLGMVDHDGKAPEERPYSKFIDVDIDCYSPHVKFGGYLRILS